MIFRVAVYYGSAVPNHYTATKNRFYQRLCHHYRIRQTGKSTLKEKNIDLRTASGKRIKALIADSPISDPYRLSMAEFPPALLKAPAFVTNLVGQIATHQNTMTAIIAERSCWQFGVSSLSQLIEFGREIIEPEKIHCPTLCLASEGEAPMFLTQACEVYDALKVPKKLHIFSTEEGADAHCQVNNLTLMQEVVYDWLDETLGR